MHSVVLMVVAVVAGMIVLDRVLERVGRKHRAQMITCVIRPEQLNSLTTALKKAHLMPGMTLTDVRGFGRQKGGPEESSKDPIRFLPKLKIEILVRELDVEPTMNIISENLRTGQIGDGKIIVYKAVSSMRVRTGERGLSAL
jgi:nitrogen regulatory protein P-II 1